MIILHLHAGLQGGSGGTRRGRGRRRAGRGAGAPAGGERASQLQGYDLGTLRPRGADGAHRSADAGAPLRFKFRAIQSLNQLQGYALGTLDHAELMALIEQQMQARRLGLGLGLTKV